MAKCEICGKSPQFGHNVSHSKRATNRQFRPNVQRRRLELDGRMRRLYICTRCLRTLDKAA
jgi:large subunit ribosomal protein L28